MKHGLRIFRKLRAQPLLPVYAALVSYDPKPRDGSSCRFMGAERLVFDRRDTEVQFVGVNWVKGL